MLLEEESYEYGACEFKLGKAKIKFRVAKITPTKIGQFVTFWKRQNDGPIEPFNFLDKIDFYVVSVRMKSRFGHFVFPKSVLREQGILTYKGKEGKRAIRVYPPWDKTTSKQAQKTQTWQREYFVEHSETNFIDEDRIKELYS